MMALNQLLISLYVSSMSFGRPALSFSEVLANNGIIVVGAFIGPEELVTDLPVKSPRILARLLAAIPTYIGRIVLVRNVLGSSLPPLLALGSIVCSKNHRHLEI